ncbi:hypothetical protein ACLKA6_010702 [Drosophila palustris]
MDEYFRPRIDEQRRKGQRCVWGVCVDFTTPASAAGHYEVSKCVTGPEEFSMGSEGGSLHFGPEMLVAFHSSPFSAPLQQGIPNRGFELDVDILFTDSDSYDFAQGTKNLCEFHINASNPGK